MYKYVYRYIYIYIHYRDLYAHNISMTPSIKSINFVCTHPADLVPSGPIGSLVTLFPVRMLRYILVGEIEDIVIIPTDPINTALAPRPESLLSHGESSCWIHAIFVVGHRPPVTSIQNFAIFRGRALHRASVSSTRLGTCDR